MKTDPNDVLPAMCGTCPFRHGSKYAHLARDLSTSALTEANRECHSTGTNAIGGRTGKPARFCRGARNVQLAHFHAIGFLSAPTDEAWREKLSECKRRRK